MEKPIQHSMLGRLSGNKKPVKGAGFTLVEVLVSIIIFSIGLIGVARLQVVAKQSNFDAVQRVTATSIAQDLLSRMRSNHTVLNIYVSNSGTTTVGRGSISTEPTPVCDSSGNACSASEIAEHDLWEIEQALDGATELDTGGNIVGGLSEPTLCITGPALGDSGVYTVAIAWRGKAELSNPTANTCGDDTGLYGAANEYRRILVMETFITTL